LLDEKGNLFFKVQNVDYDIGGFPHGNNLKYYIIYCNFLYYNYYYIFESVPFYGYNIMAVFRKISYDALPVCHKGFLKNGEKNV
jgi:hypothetical protein